MERVFKVPNIGKVIEEGKTTPTKFCYIKLCKLQSKLEPEMYTTSGWPSVSGDALKSLAGKVSAEFDFTDEAHQLESEGNIGNFPETEVLETKEGVSEDKEAAYGTAYAAFGGGLKGKEACHAIAALCEVCSIDSLISNFILPLQVIMMPYCSSSVSFLVAELTLKSLEHGRWAYVVPLQIVLIPSYCATYPFLINLAIVAIEE